MNAGPACSEPCRRAIDAALELLSGRSPGKAIVSTSLDRANGAAFSPAERYRYLLWRVWNPDAPLWSFGMLNPSTADHLQTDPTITRCQARALAGGAGGLLVWNLFAFRATDPRDMKAAGDPVGPANDAAIVAGTAYAAMNVAGWGARGGHLSRDRRVRTLLYRESVELHALAFTAAGQPRHPLYLPASLEPQPWDYPR